MEIKPVTRNTQHVTRNKKLILTLKILVGAGIIFFLFRRIDLKCLTSKLFSMRWSYLIGCLFLFSLAEILHSYRWKILLKCKSIKVSIGKLIYLNFVGLFFNLFFPSTIGGDMARMYQLSKHTKNTSEAVASVFMERGIGFFALLCLTPIMVFYSSKQIETHGFFFPIILLFLTVMITLFVLVSLRGLMKRWHSANNNYYKKIAHFHDVFYSYRCYKKNILFAVAISLIMIFLGIIITYMISHGLRLYIPLNYFIIFVPLIALITMIPVSIHGIGLREGAFVFFFSRAGLSTSDALSISLISYVLVLIFGIIGGMAYVVNGMQAFDRINKIINPVHPVHPVKK